MRSALLVVLVAACSKTAPDTPASTAAPASAPASTAASTSAFVFGALQAGRTWTLVEDAHDPGSGTVKVVAHRQAGDAHVAMLAWNLEKGDAFPVEMPPATVVWSARGAWFGDWNDDAAIASMITKNEPWVEEPPIESRRKDGQGNVRIVFPTTHAGERVVCVTVAVDDAGDDEGCGADCEGSFCIGEKSGVVLVADNYAPRGATYVQKGFGELGKIIARRAYDAAH